MCGSENFESASAVLHLQSRTRMLRIYSSVWRTYKKASRHAMVHVSRLHQTVCWLILSEVDTAWTVWRVSNVVAATKQCLHPQRVAEISRHSVLSENRIRQCGTSSGLATRTQISVCKSPFPSAGTAVSLLRAKTVQQRPLLPRDVETRLPDCRVTH